VGEAHDQQGIKKRQVVFNSVKWEMSVYVIAVIPFMKNKRPKLNEKEKTK